MARQPKPFFRKQTKSWYCSIGGKQISLGKDREAAHQKFHELMTDRDSVSGDLVTLYDLSQTYLDWCLGNRKKTTYDKHLLYLKSFIGQVGKRLKIAQLKQFHLTKWRDTNLSWSDNSAHRWRTFKRPSMVPFQRPSTLYLNGCCPKEARCLEAKHIHVDMIIYPADKSKGEHCSAEIGTAVECHAFRKRHHSRARHNSSPA